MGRDFMAKGASSEQVQVPMTEISNVTETSLPPGFRFHPTDEELVSYYLKKKVLGKPMFDAIGEVDIYKHEPRDLSGYSKMKTRDQEWYFFSVLDKKYCVGNRMVRGIKKGYWRETGKEREILRGDDLIGMVKKFVYHNGCGKYGTRTRWVMNEYRLVGCEPQKKGQSMYVLCKIFRKDDIVPPVLEKEWEVWDGKALIPGENVILHAYDTDKIQQRNQSQSKNLTDINKLPKEFEIDDSSEDNDEETPYVAENLSLCVLNKEDSLPLIQYKRKRRNSHSIRNSNNSSGITHDHCPSTTTTTTSSAAVTNTDIAAALFKLSLNMNKNQTEPVAALTSSPTKENKDLQKENREIILEREKLKFELMEADLLINFLQGRNIALREEIKELRKNSK